MVKKYIFEFIVVFVSITLSFWVENFRESQQEKELEIKYLEGLSRDLRQDKISLESYRNLKAIQVKSALSNIDYYDNKKILNVDSFQINYFWTLYLVKFNPTLNTYKEIISSSHLRLIEDDSVKTGFLELIAIYENISQYDVHTQHDQYDAHNNSFGVLELDNLWANHSRHEMLKSEKYVKQVNALLKSIYLKNYFIALLVATDISSRDYVKPAIDKIDKLNEAIDKTLKKLK